MKRGTGDGGGRVVRPTARSDGWNRMLAWGVAASFLFHVAVWAMWPEEEYLTFYASPDRPRPAQMIEAIPLMEIPPPPEPAAVRVPMPALTMELALAVEEELPLLPMPELEESWRVELPEPPIIVTIDEWEGFRPFTPIMVAPEVSNRGQIERFLRTRYEPVHRNLRITGVVQVQFWIDEEGTSQRSEVAASSGSSTLDRLAMELSRVIRFRPAIYRGDPVATRVVLPIRFQGSGF